MPKAPTAYCWRVDPETVGQFTGLTDMDGRYIYEDDIARCYGMESPILGQIVFDAYEAAFVFKHSNGTISLRNYNYLEVIGNIHDNPELLQKF